MEANNNRSQFKRVCVFCGSNAGHRKVFTDAALELGNELTFSNSETAYGYTVYCRIPYSQSLVPMVKHPPAKQGYCIWNVKREMDLVYGGGSVGLMGLISQKVQDGGCRVLGVIPKALVPLEISGESVGEVRIVSDMHERKSEMAREADAFIALPGGYGTMEELLEMITWSQLGIHKKPVGLLNVDGYYNSLLALFDNGVKEGFIKPGARHIVLSAPTARELLVEMERYTPRHEHVAPHESWKVQHMGEEYPRQESLH